MTTTPPQVLEGIRILDLGGIGPGPYAAMMLADLGAEVIRLSAPREAKAPASPVLDRGKRSVIVNLKSAEGVEVVRRLAASAHGVIEGFRPGVAERLGVGPAELMAANPALVYGRITGWGQTGPRSQSAGHDLNYISTAGVLSRLARKDSAPQFPVNLLGDFGGGGMQLAIGVLAALVRAKTTGTGTVVDATMADGANHLWSMMHGFEAMGIWRDNPGTNLLDSGAPFYDVYPTADGRHLGVGCIEPQFFAEFTTLLGVADRLPWKLGEFDHRDPAHWPAMRELFATAIASKTAAELSELFDGTDACATIVLTMDDAEADAHNTARGAFYRDAAGARQPAPAPRFADLGGQVWAGGEAASAATPSAEAGSPSAAGSGSEQGAVAGGDEAYRVPGPAPKAGADTADVLASAGFSSEEIDSLTESGAVAAG